MGILSVLGSPRPAGTPVGSATSITTTQLPPEFRPFITDIFQKAKAQQEGLKFVPFTGPRIRDFGPLQQEAFTGLTDLARQGIGTVPDATSATFLTGAREAAARAGRPITVEDIQRLSSPFQQEVIDVAKRKAQEDFDIQIAPKIAAESAAAGSFGGSRAGVIQEQALQSLQEQLSDIQTKGSAQAFAQAQQAFQDERAAAAGLSGFLERQMTAVPNQALKELAGIQTVGESKQLLDQKALDLAYQDFLEEREFPTRALQEYQASIRGFPYTPAAYQYTTQTAPTPSLGQTLLGAAATGAGLYGSFGGFGFGSPTQKAASGGQIRGGLSGVVESHQNNTTTRSSLVKKQGSPMRVVGVSIDDIISGDFWRKWLGRNESPNIAASLSLPPGVVPPRKKKVIFPRVGFDPDQKSADRLLPQTRTQTPQTTTTTIPTEKETTVNFKEELYGPGEGRENISETIKQIGVSEDGGLSALDALHRKKLGTPLPNIERARKEIQKSFLAQELALGDETSALLDSAKAQEALTKGSLKDAALAQIAKREQRAKDEKKLIKEKMARQKGRFETQEGSMKEAHKALEALDQDALTTQRENEKNMLKLFEEEREEIGDEKGRAVGMALLQHKISSETARIPGIQGWIAAISDIAGSAAAKAAPSLNALRKEERTLKREEFNKSISNTKAEQKLLRDVQNNKLLREDSLNTLLNNYEINSGKLYNALSATEDVIGMSEKDIIEVELNGLKATTELNKVKATVAQMENQLEDKKREALSDSDWRIREYNLEAVDALKADIKDFRKDEFNASMKILNAKLDFYGYRYDAESESYFNPDDKVVSAEQSKKINEVFDTLTRMIEEGESVTTTGKAITKLLGNIFQQTTNFIPSNLPTLRKDYQGMSPEKKASFLKQINKRWPSGYKGNSFTDVFLMGGE